MAELAAAFRAENVAFKGHIKSDRLTYCHVTMNNYDPSSEAQKRLLDWMSSNIPEITVFDGATGKAVAFGTSFTPAQGHEHDHVHEHTHQETPVEAAPVQTPRPQVVRPGVQQQGTQR